MIYFVTKASGYSYQIHNISADIDRSISYFTQIAKRYEELVPHSYI
jgi:hypothetical protein